MPCSSPLTHRVQVVYAHWDSKVLWVDIFVPHKELCAYRDVSERAIVNVATILKSEQVLLASVAGAPYKPHPT